MVIANDVELKSTVKTNQIDPLTTVVPTYYFKFTDFSHVLSPGKGSLILTDVLGRIKAIQPLEQVLVRGKTMENKREFTL
ncbi:hypothetical protein NC652_003295 [Populus alba x Populus x berolinensis]|nr:hypothetical protein NC652_003295 [Populus alba x Populus x berolinensis]